MMDEKALNLSACESETISELLHDDFKLQVDGGIMPADDLERMRRRYNRILAKLAMPTIERA